MMRNRRTLLFIFTIFSLAMIAVCANVFALSITKTHLRSGTNLEGYVNSVNFVTETTVAKRGYIYDSNGIVVAQDVKTYNIICYLDESRVGINNAIAYIDDIDYTASVLAKVLEGDQESIANLLYEAKDKDLYQTEIGNIGRGLSNEEKEEIEEYALPGVEFNETVKRNYPFGQSYSPYLLGYCQTDENGKLQGMMGVEQYLNTELSGIDGYRRYQADDNGYILPGMSEVVKESIDGYDVYLTIDSVIQNYLDTCLNDIMDYFKADRAWGAVMNIKTGEILAWGQSDSFDPNEMNIENYNNMLSQLVYEPGSVYKAFTYAAAIDSGNYDGTKQVDSGKFCVISDGEGGIERTYDKDAKECVENAQDRDYGYVDYDYGLILSSNTVTASLLTDTISPETYREYLDRFKLFEKVDTDGILENVGTINFTWPIEMTTATFGQGLTTSSLAMMQAYTAIFGNGEMIKPYFIDKITDSNDENKIIYEGQREVVSTPIKEETAQQLQDILRRVVTDERGTARFYDVEGIEVIAKTGTGQVASEGGYDEDKVISSVMLGFPYDDPEYMVYVLYEADFTLESSYKTDAVKTLVRSIALAEGLNVNEEDGSGVVEEVESSTMPSLTGHSLSYAQEKIGDGFEIVVLGDGKNVLRQYPSAGEEVYQNEKIYLLTSEEFKMPNLLGYTRKELMELWSITKVSFKIDGYGIVYEQSLKDGELVTSKSVIEVKLKDPEE